jgi:hypothetical protein
MSSNNPFSDSYEPPESRFGTSSDSVESLTIGPNGEVIIPASQRRGMVGHVPILGWLMIVQGVLEFVLGILFAVMAFVGPDAVAEVAQNMPTVEETGMTAGQLKMLTMLVYGGIGAALAIIGIITAIGGWQVTQFRSRAFALFGLSVGFATVILGCYCFPTALTLGIYGLIVLQDSPVTDAFTIRRAGYSAKQVRELFQSITNA